MLSLQPGDLTQSLIFFSTVRAVSEMGGHERETIGRLGTGNFEIDESRQHRLQLVAAQFGIGGGIRPLEPLYELCSIHWISFCLGKRYDAVKRRFLTRPARFSP